MAHQRPEFFVSVRMFSSRLFNAELVNEEGKKSHHIADGCTLIYSRGDEYRAYMQRTGRVVPRLWTKR
jgi:hypothetical protein